MADITPQATRLAQQLVAAAQARDWEMLRALDQEMTIWLQTCRTNGWTDRERAAFARLQAAHRQARELCAQAADRLALQLSDMRTNKEGWMAYAEASAHSEERP